MGRPFSILLQVDLRTTCDIMPLAKEEDTKSIPGLGFDHRCGFKIHLGWVTLLILI